MLVDKIFEKFSKLIDEPITELNYSNNFELMIAVMLSAQCTDKRVNIVTKELFKKYPNLQALADARLENVENIIRSCNYYKSKSKNIISASRQIIEKYNGEIPNNFEDLIKLDGIGRKTANVILAVAFGIPTFPVDTHVFRVANRLGLTDAKNVLQSEKQLTQLVKRENWIKMHHYLILFGRYHCKALTPTCENCIFKDICLKTKIKEN